MTYTLFPLFSLTQRELMRFYRQKSRIIASIATPVIFWLLLGTGLTAAFPSATGVGGQRFIHYFFPANLVMTLLFTSIFSTISIIEDRNEGLLQSVLVAPVSKTALVGGKIFGGALIGVFQGLLFLFLAPLAGFSLAFEGFFLCLLAMFVLSFAMTGLGFVFAWRINSVQGFHSVMNLFLFPMWLTSGAFFEPENVPSWLRTLMYLNPLTYGVSVLKQGLTWEKNPDSSVYLMGIVVSVVFGVFFFAASVFEVKREKGIKT